MKHGPIQLAIMIVLVVILIFAARGAIYSFYRPGWELSAGLVAMQNGDTELKKSGETANLQFDFDDPAWGLPDIKATVSDVREEVPKMSYADLEQNFAQYKYVVEYHEYLFDIQIRTIADMALDNSNPENPQKLLNQGPFTNYWSHETSMPHCYVTNLRGTGGTQIGYAFDGGVYARFSCLPWGLLNYQQLENYTFTGYWLGVMNAKVEKGVWGIATADATITYPGWARNVESDGSQINMFQDDGNYATAYAEVPWDATKVLDPDIKSAVIVYLPFNLMAGAYEKYDMWYDLGEGGIVEVKPVDYYITYTVRMESLVVKEYTYRDPGKPLNPSPIKAPNDYVPYTVPSFWETYGLWIIVGVVGLVLLLFFFSWLGIPVLGLLLGMFRFVDARDLKRFNHNALIAEVKW